jgi:hypothetical protein
VFKHAQKASSGITMVPMVLWLSEKHHSGGRRDREGGRLLGHIEHLFFFFITLKPRVE